MAVAPDGSAYLALTNPDADITVIAYTASGIERWSRTIETSSWGIGGIVALDDGVVLSVGYRFRFDNPGGTRLLRTNDSDVAVVAWDADGSLRWEYFVDGPSFDIVGAVDVRDGTVAAVGSIGEPHDFGGGVVTGRPFVVLLDERTGAFVNATALPSMGFINDMSVVLPPDGDVVIAGRTEGGVSFDGGGSFREAGLFAGRLAPDLSVRWGRGGPAFEFNGAAVDDAGDVYLTGIVRSDSDWGDAVSLETGAFTVFLLALDGATGQSRWVQATETGSPSRGAGPVIDADGRLWQLVTSEGDVDRLNDALLLAHARDDGAVLHQEAFGSDMSDLATGVSTRGAWLGIAGRFSGTTRFGTSTLSASAFDVFVAVFSL